MGRILTMTNKLLSFRGQIDICDANGTPQYQARGELSWLRQQWRLHQRGQEVAHMQSKAFSWKPVWQISGALGDFTVRRTSFWSMRKHYTVEGGPIDGATLTGSLWDRSFAIERGGVTLARASNALLSLRDRHQVEIVQDNLELPCVIAMLVMLLDRRQEAQAAAAG